MSATASHTPADRFAISLHEMRAAMAAEGMRKGPAGVLLAAILRLLDAIVALLEDFRAGKLDAPASAEADEVACLPPTGEKENELPPRPSPARAGEGAKSADDLDIAPLRFSAPAAVNNMDRREAQTPRQAAGAFAT